MQIIKVVSIAAAMPIVAAVRMDDNAFLALRSDDDKTSKPAPAAPVGIGGLHADLLINLGC